MQTLTTALLLVQSAQALDDLAICQEDQEAPQQWPSWSSGFPSPPFPCFLTIRGGSWRSFDPGGPSHTR